MARFCSIHEFETYLYTHEDALDKELAAEYTRCQKMYKPQLDYSEINDLLMSGASLFGDMLVYMFPRLAISYSLCDICALEMKEIRREDPDRAWNSYVRLCEAGGSLGYEELLEKVGLTPAYKDGMVKKVTKTIKNELLKIIESDN